MIFRDYCRGQPRWRKHLILRKRSRCGKALSHRIPIELQVLVSAFLSLGVAFGLPSPTTAQSTTDSVKPSVGPHPPCDGDVDPPYPDLNQPVSNKSWDASVLGRSWQPPSCLGRNSSGFTTLVTTVGRFRSAVDDTRFLQTFGAVSQWKGLRYWSVSHREWKTLITESFALTTPQGQRRPDFSINETKQGSELYFEQDNNLTGKANYRMQIVKASQDHVVVKIENIGPIRYLLVPVLHTGDLQSIYFLDRESEGIWRYYSIVRTGKNASRLIAGKDASAFNRAVAVYRHLAGIPDNMEPPAAVR
jgi:uncharacterized protein DUF6675